MKTPARLLGVLGLGLATLFPVSAQTPVPLDNFDSLSTGNLHGQGGWTVTNVAGTSQAVVTTAESLSGAQSLYLYDGDSVNNPKAWREPTGSNVTHGTLEFSVKESPATTGRDYWIVVLSNVGTSTANYKLALSSATVLTLYGGSGGATSLATVNTTSANGIYDPTGWNTFLIEFNETANTVVVYLNGGSSPILTSSDTATNWTVGRHLFASGASTYTDMGVYFDAPVATLPEVPFDGFESYSTGNLHGQGGWTVTAIGGSSQATVSTNYALVGGKSAYLLDADSVSNPKAWREPTGSNFTSGRFDFAVLESPDTTGRDYWTAVFGNTGTTVANFKVGLSTPTQLTLYGGSGGFTALANVSTTSTNGTYDPASWNTFSIEFDETANTVAVYLNGGSSPILTSSDTATNWTVGRYLFAPGASTFTNMAIYLDESLFDGTPSDPEWETTEKLRYAPPTLVAPTEWVPATGFSTKVFAADEDVIVQTSSTVTRTGNLGLEYGRNVRVIGGDLGNNYFYPRKQTGSVYMEGLKADHSVGLQNSNGVLVQPLATRAPGNKEQDGIAVDGRTDGILASVYLQNSSIRGIHGVGGAHGHGPGVPITSVVLTSVGPGNNYAVSITLAQPMTLYKSAQNMIIVGGTTEPKLAGTYYVNLTADTTSTTFVGTRADFHNPMPPGISMPLSGTGGYVWYSGPGHSFDISSIELASISGNTVTVTIDTVVSETLPAGTYSLQVKSTTEPKLNGRYSITLASQTTAGTFTATRVFSTLPAAPFNPGLTGTGGFFNHVVHGYDALHPDAYTSNANGIYGTAYLYRVTLDSSGSCFIGMNQKNTEGMRGLVMTRVNTTANGIYPQSYDSQALYLGTSDASAPFWGSLGFTVDLDRVYIKPRANRDVTGAVWPGVGATRHGVPVGVLTNDGGETGYWPPVMDISGVVIKSDHANGYPEETGYTTRDYADLTGPNAPGLGYVSPGYADMQPLLLGTITGSPALTTINATSVNVGTFVTRLDVDFTGAGYVIDLAIDSASGKFAMDPNNKRNVIVSSALASGVSYPVTVTATEQGNSSNQITKVFTIVAP